MTLIALRNLNGEVIVVNPALVRFAQTNPDRQSVLLYFDHEQTLAVKGTAEGYFNTVQEAIRGA